MGIIGTILAIVGYLLMLVFGIIILVKAFKVSVGWGLISLLVPFGIFVFIAKNWADCKSAFMKWLAGFVLMIIGSVLGGIGAVGQLENMPMDSAPSSAPANP